MVVQHNISGMNANRQLNITTGVQAKSSEKLSSGYRINRAADDAAGLAISEKMRRQIRGLSQASNNAQDGVSWCQIADGALDEVDNMLSRAKELAVKAANDTLTNADRAYINEEMKKLSSEIDRTHSSTEFNNIPIFTDEGYAPIDATTYKSALTLELPTGQTVSFDFVDAEGNKIQPNESSKASGTATNYDADYAGFIKNVAASAVSNLSGKFPKLFAASSSDNIKIGLELANIDGKNNTLAQAWFGLARAGDSTGMEYWMKVDTSDYSAENYGSMTSAQKADLAGVIAHEMTHLVMYDTLTDGMAPGATNPYPKWFKEGMAQTSSGDNGWLSGSLDQNSSDDAIKNYMSQMTTMEYGAGYLATMYLGYAVSAKAGNTSVTSDNIASGLDTLMEDMAKNRHTLNQAIAALTDYSGQGAFESGFKGANLDSLAFVKEFLNQRGSTGAGSLFGSLGQSEEQIFGNAGNGASISSYMIQTDNTKYRNVFGAEYNFPERDTSMGDASLLYLQVGSENTEEDRIPLKRFNIRMDSLTEGNTFDVSTREQAQETIDTVDIAGRNVARVRSYYGAMQNRLEHTIKNLDNVVENTQNAESLIRDTDMAAEMVMYSNNNILMQAGQSMLAQANQTNQGVLSLLQ